MCDQIVFDCRCTICFSSQLKVDRHKYTPDNRGCQSACVRTASCSQPLTVTAWLQCVCVCGAFDISRVCLCLCIRQGSVTQFTLESQFARWEVVRPAALVLLLFFWMGGSPSGMPKQPCTKLRANLVPIHRFGGVGKTKFNGLLCWKLYSSRDVVGFTRASYPPLCCQRKSASRIRSWSDRWNSINQLLDHQIKSIMYHFFVRKNVKHPSVSASQLLFLFFLCDREH